MATAPHFRPLTLEDYLTFPEDADREREIIRGRLFVAPRPMHLHQFVLLHIARLLGDYVLRLGGHLAQVVVDADLLIGALDTYVSPDLMYFGPDSVVDLLDLMAQRRRIHVSHVRPELVVEILTPGSEARDLVEKVRDYAEAGIPHYWVFDPQSRSFREFVLTAEATEYQCITHLHGRVRPRLFASQRPAFTLDLARLWPIPQV